MSEAIKTTKGEAYRFREGSSTVYVSVRIGGGWAQEVAACGPTANGSGEQQANADLIVEAFNVATTTGLTPCQLVERVKELEGALGEYMSAFGQALEAHGIQFAQQQVIADELARAALSNALPNAAAKEAGR